MAVTILDVARLAGVSYQTVSNVINGRISEMSPETRQRVERAISELDYHPNVRARSLRRQRGQVIGLLAIDTSTNFIAAPFSSQIIASLVAAADRAGYSMMIKAARPESSDTLPEPSVFSQLYRERRIDAAIIYLSGPRPVRERYLAQLAESGCPFVVIHERFASPVSASVLSGDYEGGIEATSHLLSLGHRAIGFLTEDAIWPSLEARQAGYEHALQLAGLTPDPSLIERSPESPSAAAAASGRLLARHPDMTALVCYNDLAAMGAIAGIQGRGRRVPEDFSVVGFDDFAFAAYLSPALTTVRLLGHEVGQRAIELLIGKVEEGEFASPEVVFPPTLLVRGTTAPQRGRGGSVVALPAEA